MKKLTVLLATLLVFFTADAQQILSGLYSGSMYNDSTRMLQKYELALSEYRGKVMGYSYVTFVVNDTFYYGIRRVKGYKNNNNELILTDEELLANNFPESPAKRVKRTATFQLAQEDTITHLTGTWQTNRTRQYYSVGGATRTERSADSTESALVAHLKELKIINDKPNYQDEPVVKNKPKKEEKKPKETEVAKRSEKQNAESEPVTAQGNKEPKAGIPSDNKAVTTAANPKTDKNAVAATKGTQPTGSNTALQPEAKPNTLSPANGATARNTEAKTDASVIATTSKGEPVISNTTPNSAGTTANNTTAKKESASPKEGASPIAATAGNPATGSASTAIDPTTGDLISEKPRRTETQKQDAEKPAVAATKPAQNTTAPASALDNAKSATTGVATTGTPANSTAANTATGNNQVAAPSTDAPRNDKAPAAVAPALPDNRASALIKTLDIVNDSITLSFYDNGVVDGDVISVFVNGQNVVASAKLNEVALKKTIHLTNFAADSVEVTLVAETLGSIPPNTGLVLVYDGDKRYDVRFSADLKTNASIVFRKVKK